MPRFTFAWVDEEDAFDSEVHLVEDELIVEFSITQEIGAFGIMEMKFLSDPANNSFLTAPHKQWCYFADNGVVLFKGRILGVPQKFSERLIEATFYARPSDYEARKKTKADELNEDISFFDPVFVKPERRDDPDAALDARSDGWYIDPVTHDVDIASWITPTGVVDLTANAINGSLDFSHSGNPPASEYRLTATAQWEQSAVGAINIASKVSAAFGGSGYGSGVYSLTGLGLLEDWPPENKNISRDYEYGSSVVYSTQGRSSGVQGYTQHIAVSSTGGITIPNWNFKISRINVRYETVRRRNETINFVMQAQVQPLLSDPGEDAIIDEEFSSVSLNEPVDEGGATPLSDSRQALYFNTPRGIQSVRYLVQLAAARLLMRALAARMGCAVPFDVAKTLTLHNGFSITSTLLPGGSATAKISTIRLSGSGISGDFIGEVEGGVMIGTGLADPTAVAGTPTIVEEGWVEPGWQIYAGGVEILGGGRVGMSSIAHVVPNDDGIDFFNPEISDFVDSVDVDNATSEQISKINAAYLETPRDAIDVLRSNPTTICVNFKDIDKGPFDTPYALTLTPLAVPKMVDL